MNTKRIQKFIFLFFLAASLSISTTCNASHATSLVNGFGGPANFGTSLGPNDDGYTSAINITSVFPGGLDFFGNNYSHLYVNNNGNLTFTNPQSTYTPYGIAGSSTPIIAPFFGDVDTRGGATAATGGNTTGSNLAYYALSTSDPNNRSFTATWDDVGYYYYDTAKTDSFQVSLIDKSSIGSGDFDIIFRYQDINWTTGDASYGSNGLGGYVARAGWSNGDGTHYYELPQSGNQDAMLALNGTYEWQVRNGEVSPPSSPAPEPSSMVFGLMSLGGLLGLKKRK